MMGCEARAPPRLREASSPKCGYERAGVGGGGAAPREAEPRTETTRRSDPRS